MVVYRLEQSREMGLRSTYRRCRFRQKITFSDEAHLILILYVNKQHFRIWGTVNPHAYIEKPTHPKPVTVRWRFSSKVSKECQLPSLSGHVERIFVNKNWRGGYGQHLVSTGRCYVPRSRSYTRCLTSCFWKSHYHWCRLATSELRCHTVGLLFVGCRQS